MEGGATVDGGRGMKRYEYSCGGVGVLFGFVPWAARQKVARGQSSEEVRQVLVPDSHSTRSCRRRKT